MKTKLKKMLNDYHREIVVNLKYLLNKTPLLKINLVRLVTFLSNVCLDIHFFVRKRKGFTISERLRVGKIG